MKTRTGSSAALGLIAIVLLQGAALGQASRTADPFGNLPAPGEPTPAQTQPAPAITTPAGLSVPPFPGAGLLNDRPPFLAGVNVDHKDLSYRGGDTLTVRFTSEREAYLYLIYHQADGQSYLLFPNEAHLANRVPAGKWVTIPEEGQDFRFRISPPFGTEVLQVLATLQPAPELESLVKKTGRAAPVAKDSLDTLATRLKKDMTAWTEHRVPIRTAPGEQPTPVRKPARKPARAGLFVGVNKFESDKEKDEGKNARFRLGAELMAKVMAERGQLDPQRTRTLVGEETTRANIEEAITRWLPSVTQPGDTVFIFYGGHGGLIKNLDGTKPDGKDGVLTTYNDAFQSQKLSIDDWDTEARKHFISDGTLARWLQELPGRQIAVLISSCHAGSMIDARLLARFASREVVRVKGISGLNVAVLVSCFPDEQTLSNVKKPVWLAYYLAEAMSRLKAPVTLEQAYEFYRHEHRLRMAQDGDTGFHEPVLTDTALLPIALVP